jgi:hypothetical protein
LRRSPNGIGFGAVLFIWLTCQTFREYLPNPTQEDYRNVFCPQPGLAVIKLMGVKPSDAPTHIYAVGNIDDFPPKAYYSAHSFVYASQCALSVPTAASQTIQRENCDMLLVPVHFQYIPHPASFPLIEDYLYLQDIDRFRCELILGYRKSIIKPDLLDQLVQHHTVLDILIQLTFIHGVWRNVYFMGVFDSSPMWGAIDYAWELLTAALEKQGAVTGPVREFKSKA